MFLVVELVYQGLSPRLGIDTCIFLNLFRDLTDDILSVVGDVPVDSETLMVTSLNSRISRLILSEVPIGLEW
jgi:hypothetical protein